MDHVRDQKDSGVLADVEFASRHVAASLSSAGYDAATNLLAKASKALEMGDDERAEKFVDRAAGLPFDEHEEVVPAIWAAYTELFMLLADTAEESAQDDALWLDAALDVLESSDELGRSLLRQALSELAPSTELTDAELRRLQAAILDVPAGTKVEDLRPSARQTRTVVMSILHIQEDFVRTFARLGVE